MITAMISSQVIDRLGGTSATAKLCEISIPAVCRWRHSGIPPARLMFLKVVRPDVFLPVRGEQAIIVIKNAEKTPYERLP